MIKSAAPIHRASIIIWVALGIIWVALGLFVALLALLVYFPPAPPLQTPDRDGLLPPAPHRIDVPDRLGGLPSGLAGTDGAPALASTPSRVPVHPRPRTSRPAQLHQTARQLGPIYVHVLPPGALAGRDRRRMAYRPWDGAVALLDAYDGPMSVERFPSVAAWRASLGLGS